MTKMIKMSLVAAVAVVGLSTSVSASVNLEDAIKGVKIKGYVSYTMEEYTDKKGNDNEAQHDIDVRVQANIPVNDNYSVTVRVDEANDDDTDDIDPSATSNKNKDSGALNLQFDRVYVTYKNNGLKVFTGLQGVIASNLHDDVDGDGVKFSYNIDKSLTLSGGYFYNTTEGTDEIAGLALAGKTGTISYGLTYATMIDSDVSNGNDGTVTDNGSKIVDLNIGTKLSGLSLNLAHTTRSEDAIGTKDQSLTKVIVAGKAGDIKYAVGYAKAGKDGAEVAIDSDADASVNLVLNEVSTDAIADGSAVYVMAGTKLGGNLSAKLEHVTADGKSTVKDASETMLTLTNKITKKFKLFAKYDTWEVKKATTAKNTKITLGAKYSF